MFRFSLALLLLLGGCSSVVETGTVNDKDFCFGVCSLNPRAPEQGTHEVEPINLNLVIKAPQEDGVPPQEDGVPAIDAELQKHDTGEGCSKETPDLCY